MIDAGAVRYLERIGEPFLFLEERLVTVAAGQSHVVTNHLPKAVFVLEGLLRHSSPEGPPVQLKPGSVLINFKKQRHTYLPPGEGKWGEIRVLRLTLPWDFGKARRRGVAGEDGFGPWMAARLPAYAILQMEEGEGSVRLLQELRGCLMTREAGRRYRANAVARLIFLQLMNEPQARDESTDATARLLKSLEAFLDANLQRPLALADMARAVDRSEEHIARLYRRHRGATIFEELRRLRIKRAQYLLLCTDLGINRIADQTGFATLAHFSRTFKEEIAMSPSAYRAKSGFRSRSESNPATAT